MPVIGSSDAVVAPGLPGSEARGFVLDDIGPRAGGERSRRPPGEVR